MHDPVESKPTTTKNNNNELEPTTGLNENISEPHSKKHTTTTTTTATTSTFHPHGAGLEDDNEDDQHENLSDSEHMDVDYATTQQQASTQRRRRSGDTGTYHDTAELEEGEEDENMSRGPTSDDFGNNEHASSNAADGSRNGENHDEEKKMDVKERNKKTASAFDDYNSGDKRKRGSAGETADDNQVRSDDHGIGDSIKRKTPDGKKDGAASNNAKNSNGGRLPSAAGGGNGSTSGGGGVAVAAAASNAQPPPPVLKGTLSYNLELRRHLIRGMWNYENSNAFPAQRFELLRNLDPDEDVTVLPKDGEFHGSFSLAYFHTTSKGKQKERSKVIPESGVKIKFTPIPGKDLEFKVDGRGTNQFGIFNINGTATPSPHEGDPVFNIVLRKRYEPSAPPAATVDATVPSIADPATTKKSKKRKLDDTISGGSTTAAAAAASDKHAGGDDEHETGPLPPPSQSYASHVVCLRGKLYMEESDDLGVTEVVHRINGMWSSGLDIILADPQNVRGLCNRFEYEHKSTVPTSKFPLSGRYSGWFDLSNEDGTRTRINERDVVLKFRKNNAGYHNVEGKGSNAFGKYNISGTLTLDNIITIFRHFLPRKAKSSKAVTSAPPPINAPGTAGRRPSVPVQPEPQLKLEEVEIPPSENSDDLQEPILPPQNGLYSAVSRGVLRLNEDGSHTCQGKWAVTRDHFNSGQTSNFSFRLEAHLAAEAAAKTGPETAPVFPLDSALYKGSFALKKGASRYQTIIDQQIVMKFRKNTQGAYNVYGKGVNPIGIFNLMGTLIMSGTTGGQVELYRVYPVESKTPTPKSAPTTPAAAAVVPPKPVTSAATATPVAAAAPSTSTTVTTTTVTTTPPKPAPVIEPVAEIKPPAAPMPMVPPVATTILPGPPRPGLSRRESSRLVKLPSKLEDDDPKAQLARIMDKCYQILRFIREKDVSRGGFFSEPVDPVALGIPTYLDVINEPMDLGTIHRRMEANEVTEPEEFARLVRLVFENAITFNIDPSHAVHQAARNLLILFTQKYRDVERLVQTFRKVQKGPAEVDDKNQKKGKEDKKMKKDPEEIKSPKQRRLEEAQAMAAANRSTMDAIVTAAPAGGGIVSRSEFSALLQMVQQLSSQIVHTHTLLADLCSSTPEEIISSSASPRAHVPNSMPIAQPANVAPTPVAPVATAPAAKTAAAAATTTPTPAPQPKKKPAKKKNAEPAAPPIGEMIASEDTRPLTLQEQELLVETIGNLQPSQLPDIVRIIRESASLSGDEEEIDLEIDLLDTATQRKLLRHVSKFIKPAKRTKQPKNAVKKANKSTPKATQQPKKTEKPPPAKEKKVEPPPKPKTNPDSFFVFGSKGDSDSESEEEETPAPPPANTHTHTGGKVLNTGTEDSFNLGNAFGEGADDDEDIANGGITANWNLSKPVEKSTNGDGDEDDAWGAAREEAAAAKAREAERKAREEKLKVEAEMAKHERLATAAARGELLRAKRMEEEANEARLREQQEKEAEEARKLARAAARAQVQSVEQTVDLDAQRDIMKQYEQSFLEKDLGSASPSSDFGF